MERMSIRVKNDAILWNLRVHILYGLYLTIKIYLSIHIWIMNWCLFLMNYEQYL